MTSWKLKAAQSIVSHAAPASTPSPSAELKARVEAALAAGKLSARDADFARSVIASAAKWDGFTDNQARALENVLARTSQISKDQPLAAALARALPNLNASDARFAQSLLDGFSRYNSFTDRQRPHVERLAKSVHSVDQEVPGYAPQAPVVDSYVEYRTLTALVNLDKFARFTVGDLQLTLKNDGSVIWTKFGGTLFGVIDSRTSAFRKLQRGLDATTMQRAIETLDIVAADPLKVAKESGILTGRCSCCGRPLTDPASIEIGIGPICLAKF